MIKWRILNNLAAKKLKIKYAKFNHLDDMLSTWEINNKKINDKNYILSQKDEKLLNLFQSNLLNETVLHPFYPVRHINKKFVKFISNSGKPLFNDFVFQPKTRN